jgi:hypothetical protein
MTKSHLPLMRVSVGLMGRMGFYAIKSHKSHKSHHFSTGAGGILSQPPAIDSHTCDPKMPSGFLRPSASDTIEAGVVDNMTLMRRTSQATDNTIVADTKKRDILNRRETTTHSACFKDSSRFGLVLRHIFPLDVDYMAITAFGIPLILGVWRQK